MLRLIDDQLQRLVGYLRTSQLLANTLVVFVSDHGEFCGDYGLFRKGLGLPQVSIRIPMLWFGGPVSARNPQHPAVVSIVDIFPTLCEALGVPIPKGVQGRSLWPLLAGNVEEHPEFKSVYVEHGVGGKISFPAAHERFGHPADTVVIGGTPRTNFDGTRTASTGFRRAVVTREWKLIYDLENPLEMYHLTDDPYELLNHAEDPSCASVRNELLQELLWWSVRLDDTLQVRRYEVEAPMHNWYREAANPK